MSRAGDAFREGETAPVHPLSVISVIVTAGVIVLFCLSWARGCTDRRDFVQSCLAVGGVATYSSEGQACKGQP